MDSTTQHEAATVSVFYINLDHATERSEHMEHCLAVQGLLGQTTRFSAKNALSDDLRAGYRWRFSTRQWRLERTEMACLESHRCVWQEIVATGADIALVMEDDVVFSPRFGSVISEVCANAPSFDVVKLDGVTANLHLGPKIACGGAFLRSLNSLAFSSAAYLVSGEGAKRLIAETEEYCYPVDLWQFRPRKDWVQFQLDPAICVQGMLIASTDKLVAPAEILKSERMEVVKSRAAIPPKPLWFWLKCMVQSFVLELPNVLWRTRAMLRSGGRIGRPELLDDFEKYR